MQVNGTWFCADARSAIFSADEQNRWVETLYRLQLCCAVLCCNNSNEHKNVFSKCLQQNLRQINVSIAECFIFHVFILYLSLFCFCFIVWYRYRDLSFFIFLFNAAIATTRMCQPTCHLTCLVGVCLFVCESFSIQSLSQGILAVCLMCCAHIRNYIAINEHSSVWINLSVILTYENLCGSSWNK